MTSDYLKELAEIEKDGIEYHYAFTTTTTGEKDRKHEDFFPADHDDALAFYRSLKPGQKPKIYLCITRLSDVVATGYCICIADHDCTTFKTDAAALQSKITSLKQSLALGKRGYD
jgi:hypothetical protein